MLDVLGVVGGALVRGSLTVMFAIIPVMILVGLAVLAYVGWRKKHHVAKDPIIRIIWLAVSSVIWALFTGMALLITRWMWSIIPAMWATWAA